MSAIQKRARVGQTIVLVSVLPLALYGFSSGPPIGRTGAPADGGQNCTACHRTFAPANSGPGRIRISAASYTPGARQTITIAVEDPTAQRWGFQLTARYRSNENIAAGTFQPTDVIRVRCDPDGRDAPCNGAKEFVEHTAAATQLGATGHGTFTVEWTPPGEDYGEIVFYAAGNAANGDGTNLNDHIYTTSTVIRAACNVSGTPTLQFTGDAASLRGTVAPGGLISIYGDGFLSTGNAYRVAPGDLVDGRLPTDFGCVQVSIGGRSAPILSVTGGLIIAQVPGALEPGTPADVTVRVRSGEQVLTAGSMRVQVAALAPALFTTDGTHVAAAVGGKPVTDDAPAKPGETVSLFGTGCGPAEPAAGDGVFPGGPSGLTNFVTITVAGAPIYGGDITYAGAAENQPGVCQIDFRLPGSIDGGDIPVSLSMGAARSQPGTVLRIRR